MTLPNLVIAGAPKCGTTSLYRWLSDHPSTCGSHPKEPLYLLDRSSPLFDPNSSYHTLGLEGYERFFAHCRPSASVVLEATPNYLYQQTALEVLGRFRPQPQVVFVLRRPSERVYSVYQFHRNHAALLDPHLTFAEFVTQARAHDPRLKQLRDVANALDHSRYADYVAAWIDRFEQGRLSFVLFEDLRDRPLEVLKTLAQEVGLDPAFYDGYTFPRENESYRVRSRRLHRLVTRLAERLPRGAWRNQLKSLYVRASGLIPSRTPEDRALLAELEAEFTEANERLSRMTGMDLRAWLPTRT